MQQIKPTYTTNKIHYIKPKQTKPRKNNAILLIILILWNIFLTYQVIQNNAPFPRFTDSENEIIMQLEEIPMELIED
jgi:regulatory protein YycI of two-component signal transduction system YycFG